MSLSEFDLIRRFFAAVGATRDDVLLGVGDDCALVQVPEGEQLAVTVDTLVEGVHFLPGCDPESLGHKALAVNLSDLAAMGARPAWATLALTLPAADPEWLSGFSSGLGSLARRFAVQLIGGDTTSGPLGITVQVQGFVPAGEALRRDAAAAGDLIAVTGTLGDAGLALRQRQAGLPPGRLDRRLDRPTPRVEAGLALRGIARAAIDVSDGLLADLGHICRASGVGASLELSALPLSPQVQAQVKASGDWTLPLSSGDDYELCVTIPASHWKRAVEETAAAGVELTRIGVIETETGIRCRNGKGVMVEAGNAGYQHFAASPDEPGDRDA